MKSYIVTGPTASGKSDFAHKLAKVTNGVIINCDSVQVYRGIERLSANPLAVEPPPAAQRGASAPPLEGGESCLRSGAQLSGSDTPALDSPPSRGGRTALLLRGRGGGSIAERVLVSARLNAKGRTKIYDQLPMNFEPVLRDGLTIQQVFTMLTTLC